MTGERMYPVKRPSGLHPSQELMDLQKEDGATKVTTWDETSSWLFTRHDQVREILSDPRASANSEMPGYPNTSLAVAQTREQFPTFLQMDAPEHQIYRRMFTSEFSVKASEARRKETEEVVADTINRLLSLTPPVDFIEEFALVVPSTIISRILGVPYSDHDFFQTRSQTLVSGHSSQDEVEVATGEMRDYLTLLVDRKAKEPGDDLLSHVIVKHMLSGEVSRDAMVAHARLLLTGGHDTTASMIGLGTLALLVYPDQREQLHGHPELLNNAVEEMLRFFTITHLGRRRVATADIDLGHTKVREGEGVIADHFLGNRDPHVFPNPHAFDVTRETRQHMAFGYGPHQCLGQHLARVELQAVFKHLFTAVPTLELAVPFEQLRFKEAAVVYGLEELPVTW